MSANQETSPRKRRGENANHQPSKKIKHTTGVTTSQTLQAPDDGDRNESKKKNSEKVALNGEAHVGKIEGTEKKKKQRKDKEDIPKVPGLEGQELDKNKLSPSPKEKRKGKDVAVKDSIKSVDAVKVRSSKDKMTRSKKAAKEWSWSISQPLGGCFAPVDPIFSADEKYLLVATKQSLNIYSTTTSLLVRRLYIGGQGIVGVKISLVHSNLAYIADKSGTVDLWNWVDGDKILSVAHSGRVHAFDVVISSSSDTEMIYLLGSILDDEVSTEALSQISAFAVQNQTSTPVSKLFQSQYDLQLLQVLNGGEFITVASNSVVIIGKRIKARPGQTGEELGSAISEYRWNELGFPQGLTCFDAHVKSNAVGDVNKSNQSKKAKNSGNIDIAFGSNEGSIFLYEDIANNILKPSTLRPRKLHWHRNSVGSVKWSVDGNYLISGGSETVLFLWQLETGRTQQLPHLTAAIKAINVSPSGTLYALLLDDNSVMALSTSELVPTSVIGGPQTGRHHHLSRLTNSTSYGSKSLIQPIPATSSTFFPNQILVAVPASQTLDNKALSAPFIQTFDWATCRHVSRQAVARNNVTHINTAPDGTPIIEANVTLMKLSHDGLWLTTAEDWTPSSPSQIKEADRLAERRETYLKFWRWDTKSRHWMMEARIDSPHQSTTLTGANRTLALDSNPTKVGFASAGEDGMVRIWSPKTKLSDGRIIKGVNPKGVTTWLCTQLIDIGKAVDTSDLDGDSQFSGVPSVAKIAFSDDGSVLAVAFEDAKRLSPGLVHFVDISLGTLRLSQPLVYGTGLANLQFLGRHLIVLSSELRVWDIITNRLVYGYPLKQGNLPQTFRQNLNQLAASRKYGRFIIAIPTLDNSKGSEPFSRVAVFDPLNPQPCLIQDIPSIVTSLIPLDSAYGFAVIDSEAELRLVKPDLASTIDPLKLGEVMESEIALDIAFQQDVEMSEPRNSDERQKHDGDDEEDEEEEDDDDNNEYNPSDDGRNTIVGAHNLAKIFDSSPSFALPPVQDLFRAVASLYIGKLKTTKHSTAVSAPET